MNLVDDALVIVLAGGAGERLYPLTRERAKPAVYFGGPYRIIDFVLSNCINSGLRKAFIATQYKSLSLNRHVRQGWSIVSEELGEFRSAMNNEITTALVNSRLYTMLSMRAVDAAKREANVRDVADLTTARNRESFLSVLNRDGQPPQYLLFGEVTTMSSRGAGERERTYQLTLQMMDSSNGVIQTQKLVEVRKAYE